MEWGALWIREWRDGVTHVIVDKDLCYDDVLKSLKLGSLPVRISTSDLLDRSADQTVRCQACQRELSSLLHHVSIPCGRDPAATPGCGSR